MDKYVEKIVRARVALLLKQPFWGTLATRLQLVDATDDESGWCKTAATDGRSLFYNREFIDKLSKDELQFLIGREVEHVVYDHMDRVGGRDPKIWNAAADFVINLELEEHNVGKLPTEKSCGVKPCYDEKYRGMFAEEVYELLIKDPDFKYVEFDVHLGPGSGKNEHGDPLTEEERRALRDEIQGAIIQAAKAAGAGSVPAGVKRMLNEITEPQMDWREILNLKMQSTVKTDFNWMRCSRKTQAMGIHLPAMHLGMRVDAAVAIDTSGSMGDDMLRDLLGEVKGIMEQFTDFKLHIWCFDTSVHNPVTFTPDNLDEIMEYEIKGGGGTSFECNWEYLKNNEIVPERLVVMTDGMPANSWGDPDYCDTTFLIHSDPGGRITAPFGDTVHYTAN